MKMILVIVLQKQKQRNALKEVVFSAKNRKKKETNFKVMQFC